MYIGSEEVRTGKLQAIRPPHEIARTLGHFHEGDESHVHQAIETALSAKEAWGNINWEERAAIFLRAADLISTKYRYHMNGCTMLGQSKNVYQAEIDSACELIDFLRFNVHFLSEIYKQQPILILILPVFFLMPLFRESPAHNYILVRLLVTGMKNILGS
jgi:1-pyrroline-5-carboxylate dehydrogenase